MALKMYKAAMWIEDVSLKMWKAAACNTLKPYSNKLHK